MNLLIKQVAGFGKIFNMNTSSDLTKWGFFFFFLGIHLAVYRSKENHFFVQKWRVLWYLNTIPEWKL